MRVRRIDKNGDWMFGSGRLAYADASESVAQRVVTRLRSFAKDWFLDLEHGLPWFDLLSRPSDRAWIEQEVKRSILGTDGVRSIEVFELIEAPDRRALTVSAVVRDVYGNESSVSTAI